MHSKHSEYLSSRFHDQRGFLALLVMLLVAFFGLLAGIQSLALISLADSGRAYDYAADRGHLISRLELAVSESVTSTWENRHREGEGFHVKLADTLRQLKVEGLDVSVDASTEAPVFPLELGEGDVAPLGTPSAHFLAHAGPELRFLAGAWLRENQPRIIQFKAVRELYGREITQDFRVEYQSVFVPLIRHPLVAYDLPDELGSGRPVPAVGREASLVGGLVNARDPAMQEDLFGGTAALPYYFRRRATLAGTYAQLFSNDFVERMTRVAGPCLLHRLDLPETQTAIVSGLKRQSGSARLDLSQAGSGSFGGLSASRSVVVLASAQSGQELVLDGPAGGASEPLVLVVIGPASGSLLVRLKACARPVLVIAVHASFICEGGVWAGGLILGPDCNVTGSGKSMHFSHVSYHAGTRVLPPELVADQALDAGLAMLSPRVCYVNSKVLSHEE